MKRIPPTLLAASLLFFAGAFNPKCVSAQRPLPPPVDLDIPTPPTAVRAGGKIHLFYELHITNFRPAGLELTGVEVYKADANAKPLASYKDTELVSRLARPGTPPDLPDKRVIGRPSGENVTESTGPYACQCV